jgi:hypothetical protein
MNTPLPTLTSTANDQQEYDSDDDGSSIVTEGVFFSENEESLFHNPCLVFTSFALSVFSMDLFGKFDEGLLSSPVVQGAQPRHPHHRPSTMSKEDVNDERPRPTTEVVVENNFSNNKEEDSVVLLQRRTAASEDSNNHPMLWWTAKSEDDIVNAPLNDVAIGNTKANGFHKKKNKNGNNKMREQWGQ